LIGIQSQKVFDAIVYSKTCHKCAHAGVNQENEPIGEIPPNPNHCCSHNFNGTSKSVEPIAALKIIVRRFETGLAYVSTLMEDDDSTVCSHTQLIQEEQWPQNKSTNLCLTMANSLLHVKAIDMYLANPSHHGKAASIQMGGGLQGIHTRRVQKIIMRSYGSLCSRQ